MYYNPFHNVINKNDINTTANPPLKCWGKGRSVMKVPVETLSLLYLSYPLNAALHVSRKGSSRCQSWKENGIEDHVRSWRRTCIRKETEKDM